jgi:hemolysin III
VDPLHHAPGGAQTCVAQTSVAQTSVAQTRVAQTCDGRPRPRLRGVSHQIAFFAAVPAALTVAVTTDGTAARAAGTAFAASVAAMFGVSTLFHRRSWTPKAATWLGRLDHAMIYGLIAATYAPIGLLVVHPAWRLPVLATVWTGAFLATAAKLLWSNAPKWLAPAICIALGWVAVIVFPQIIGGIGVAGALLLLVGGLAYTGGALIYARQRPDPAPATFGYHELFHALVIVAVACQYSTVVFFVLPRG